jgi:hypothetical protein
MACLVGNSEVFFTTSATTQGLLTQLCFSDEAYDIVSRAQQEPNRESNTKSNLYTRAKL